MTKHQAIGLTRGAVLGWGLGIRVNAVLPGVSNSLLYHAAEVIIREGHQRRGREMCRPTRQWTASPSMTTAGSDVLG